jgi:thiosulfate sulfurtransferase
MAQVPQIDIFAAKTLLDADGAAFVDIRDEASYLASHIPGAVHLTKASVGPFLEESDRARSVVVYCYHGNSSLQATAWLLAQGFTQAASMAGGFEAWRSAFPDRTLTGP